MPSMVSVAKNIKKYVTLFKYVCPPPLFAGWLHSLGWYMAVCLLKSAYAHLVLSLTFDLWDQLDLVGAHDLCECFLLGFLVASAW